MQMLLIILLSLSFYSCSNLTFPKPPEVKYHYYLDMKCQRDADKKCTEVLEVNCVKYEILSLNPYKIGNQKFLPLGACETVGGYVVQDFTKVLNYQADVNKWIEDNKKCFK